MKINLDEKCSIAEAELVKAHLETISLAVRAGFSFQDAMRPCTQFFREHCDGTLAEMMVTALGLYDDLPDGDEAQKEQFARKLEALLSAFLAQLDQAHEEQRDLPPAAPGPEAPPQ